MPTSRGRRHSDKPFQRRGPTRPAAAPADRPLPVLTVTVDHEPADDQLYTALTARGWTAYRDDPHWVIGDADFFGWEPSRPPAHLIDPDEYGEPTAIHVTHDGYEVNAPQLDGRLTPAESLYPTRDEILADIDRIEALRYTPPSGH